MTPAALSNLKARLLDMIETNGNAHVDDVTRGILNGLDKRGRFFLRLITNIERDREQGFPRGSTIRLSIHGGIPAIENIIDQAERYRALGTTGRKRAA